MQDDDEFCEECGEILTFDDEELCFDCQEDREEEEAECATMAADLLATLPKPDEDCACGRRREGCDYHG